MGLEGKYLGTINDDFGIFPNGLGFLSHEVVDHKGHFSRRDYFDLIKWNVLRIRGTKEVLNFLEKWYVIVFIIVKLCQIIY